jgi:hypothetical protein
MKIQHKLLQRLQQYQDELTWTYGNNDSVITRLGLTASFFFEHGSTVEVRAKVIECFDYFYAQFGEHLNGKQFAESKFTKMTAAHYQKYRQKALEITEPNDVLAWVISSEASQDDSPAYCMKCLTERHGREKFGEKSFLKFTLPAEILFMEGGKDNYHRLVQLICNALKPFHGYGGFSLALPYAFHRYMPIEYDLAQRFIGLDVDSASFSSGGFELKEHIKVANWYTILSDAFVTQLGGEQAIRQQLSEWTEIDVQAYQGGLIIRAGEYPDLGAPEDGAPTPYVVINRLVRPIRSPEPGSLHYHMEGVNSFDKANTSNWYARFDNIPLPTEHIASDVITATDPQKMRCEATQPCPQSGYWHTPAKPNSRALFTQGGVMPDFPDSNYGATIWYWDQNQD